MKILSNDNSYELSVSESWMCQIDGKTIVHEDVAFISELITANGSNSLEPLFKTLVSLFSKVDGLYEMFTKSIEIMECEEQKSISVTKYTRSNKQRNIFSALKQDVDEYVAYIYATSKENNYVKLANSLEKEMTGNQKRIAKDEYKHSYSIVLNMDEPIEDESIEDEPIEDEPIEDEPIEEVVQLKLEIKQLKNELNNVNAKLKTLPNIDKKQDSIMPISEPQNSEKDNKQIRISKLNKILNGKAYGMLLGHMSISNSTQDSKKVIEDSDETVEKIVVHKEKVKHEDEHTRHVNAVINITLNENEINVSASKMLDNVDVIQDEERKDEANMNDIGFDISNYEDYEDEEYYYGEV